MTAQVFLYRLSPLLQEIYEITPSFFVAVRKRRPPEGPHRAVESPSLDPSGPSEAEGPPRNLFKHAFEKLSVSFQAVRFPSAEPIVEIVVLARSPEESRRRANPGAPPIPRSATIDDSAKLHPLLRNH
jgi:hypothetical protein